MVPHLALEKLEGHAPKLEKLKDRIFGKERVPQRKRGKEASIKIFIETTSRGEGG